MCPSKTLVVNHSTRFGSGFSERTQAAISAASQKSSPLAEISGSLECVVFLGLGEFFFP